MVVVVVLLVVLAFAVNKMRNLKSIGDTDRSRNDGDVPVSFSNPSYDNSRPPAEDQEGSYMDFQ